MSAAVRRGEHAIYFLTDISGRKDAEIKADAEVLLGFADTGHQKYVALKGSAAISNDRAKIKEIWTPFARAWWDSADDPRIRLVTVRPESAEIWDSPGTIAAYAKMIAAAVTGAKPRIGENKTTEL